MEIMKLDTKKIVYCSLAFGWISVFWQIWDTSVQVINVRTLGLSTTISGLILAIDNIIGLFILPLSGKLSDKCKSKYGRRTPFIFVGTVVAMTGMAGVAIAASRKILWLYIVFIVITLFAMAWYRSPALSLVPDVTLEPLRSKANAISNIVSAVFTGVAILITTVGVTKDTIASSQYYLVFGLGIAVSIATAVVFFKKVNEPKLVEEYQTEYESYIASLGEDNEPSATAESDQKAASKVKNRTKVLILLCVFFFYMAYNALVSNFTNYASLVLKLDIPVLPLIFLMAGGIGGFVPATKFAAIHGRRKAILTGFIIMATSLAVASVDSLAVVSEALPDFLEIAIICFAFTSAGFGYGYVMVNIYPFFLEYSSDKSLGQGTGIFATAMTLAQVITPILAGFLIETFGKGFEIGNFVWRPQIYLDSYGAEHFGDFRILTPYAAIFLVFALISAALIKEEQKRISVETKSGIEMFDVDM